MQYSNRIPTLSRIYHVSEAEDGAYLVRVDADPIDGDHVGVGKGKPHVDLLLEQGKLALA